MLGIESKIKDGNLYEYATIHSSLVSWEHEEHKKIKEPWPMRVQEYQPICHEHLCT